MHLSEKRVPRSDQICNGILASEIDERQRDRRTTTVERGLWAPLGALWSQPLGDSVTGSSVSERCQPVKGSPGKGFRLWSHRASVATTQITIDRTQTVVWACSDKILFTKLWQMGFGSRAWVCWPPNLYLDVGGSYMGVCRNALSHTLIF